jgi:hypothetical protein
MPAERSSQGRVVAFVAVVVACVLVAGVAVVVAIGRDSTDAAGVERARIPRPGGPGAPVMVFGDDRSGKSHGRVAVTTGTGGAKRTVSRLRCARVHFQGGRGLCLVPDRGLGAKYVAKSFDRRFRVQREFHLSGLISRARVSPDGRHGAVTSFVLGHSYEDAGAFSTATNILDLEHGGVVADLESFRISGGVEGRPADRNFWGVTFSRDGSHFYATLGTGRKTYLVRGDIPGRTVEVLHEGVECPSLSPDETRVAFKRRIEGGDTWQPYVLDLRTLEETPLPDFRGFDDQPEWLDDRTVIYGRSDGDVWAVSADGAGRPRRLLADASSPAVLR